MPETLISAMTILSYKTSQKVQIMLTMVFFFLEIDEYYARNDELCQHSSTTYQGLEVASLVLWWRDFFHVNPRY